MSKLILAVIGNGRKNLLDQTIKSALDNLQYDFFDYVMINDYGKQEYSDLLIKEYGDKWTIINHEINQGLSGSIRTLWNYVDINNIDYIFHLEEDFIFNKSIDINLLVEILSKHRDIAQVALKRQPCNIEELQAGGFMQLDKSKYSEIIYNYKYNSVDLTTHRNFFTLNPSLYPRWVVNLGWQQGWGEREFGELLFSNPSLKCAYIGSINDSPLVHHTGVYRGENWFV